MDTQDPFEGVVSPLRNAMERRGFKQLSAVQRSVVSNAMSDANLRVSSQTGSGKTVAIGLALGRSLLTEDGSVADRPGGTLAVVITPTRELAAQVRDELRWLFADVPQITTAVVTGGTDIERERRALSKGPRVVVGTPGRMLDHVRRGALKLEQVADVVLDEADQMLDMGFRDELDSIVDELPASRRSHLVSATFPRHVREFAQRFQGEAVAIEGTRLGAANADIEHVASVVHRHDRYAALVNTLLLARGQRCLVFVQRRNDASQLAESLAQDGFSALPFSGDLPQAQRTRTLNAFRTGTVGTLVATDVAARGIDVADVSTVVHFDPPFDAESYTHRSGRTGRAGNKGHSVLLVPPGGQRRVQRLLRDARVEATWSALPTAQKVLKRLTKHARRELRASLSADAQPDETQLAYAAKLLEEHDPARLVATLLELAQPKLPRQPMDVRAADAPRDPRPNSSQAFVAFQINWGETKGATPARLLAHICRRGAVSSRNIGAVRIEGDRSTFEVSDAVAAEFERKVREPDDKDPQLTIERFAGQLPPRRGKPRSARRFGPGNGRGDRSRSRRRGSPKPSRPSAA